ncbi:hydantoinase/oxoprolinase family protein [Methanolapillus ohkumae]|uniref:Hydantoinase/oxoprolinase family protein n=1 Tax=Methanolapillus ohkumae TaxID=3028298 RepID=A0AA96V7E5_9EURY|nr:hypothetical protein MsAm2_13250 [Methanosarcinaceae archaeon Am2]
MTYCLGIDTGGTYTDAVIMDAKAKTVLESKKSLTTYPSPIGGISSVLDALSPDLLKLVSSVSVSTTLSTNTVLENTGDAAALILVGDEVLLKNTDLSLESINHPIQNYIIVRGGHDENGDEATPLDTKAVRDFVFSMKEKVSAFAVSSYFSVRNPAHELLIKELITDLTRDIETGHSHPVVCGHELAQSLGAYERGVTAYLNAMLLPVTRRFAESVLSEMKRRNLSADIKILKCNGAVSGILEAMEKPVESIFSGPTASLLGASFLSGRDTCLMIDVGGTSTDISMMEGGFADISESGATVGGWKTKVQAVRMETSALGGDSQIWLHSPSISDLNSEKIRIGPRRVIPLCRAAAQFPEMLSLLQDRRYFNKLHMTEYIQPVRFFIRSGAEVSLTSEEQFVYDRIQNTPTSLHDIFWGMKYLPSDALSRLVSKKAVNMIGFTPTDVLHVLGEYGEFCTEASMIGAGILASFLDMSPVEFCRHLKQIITQKMALEIVYFLAEKGMSDLFCSKSLFNHSTSGVLSLELYSSTADSKKFIRSFLSFPKPYVKFKINVPIVMIGGPVKAFVSELHELLDAEILTPDFFEVGNAVGSLVGKVSKRIEVTVRTVHIDSKYDLRTQGILVHYPGGRRAFDLRDAAVEFAKSTGKALIEEYMRRENIPLDKVELKMKEENVFISKGTVPVQTTFIFEGFAKNLL